MFPGSIRFRYATTYSTVNHASVHACLERPLFFGFRGSRFNVATLGASLPQRSPEKQRRATFVVVGLVVPRRLGGRHRPLGISCPCAQALQSLPLLPALAPVPLNPKVGGNGCGCWFLLSAPPGLGSLRGLSLPTRFAVREPVRCALRSDWRCAKSKSKERVLHERVGTVSRHAPALMLCFWLCCRTSTAQHKAKALRWLSDGRYWTENGQGEQYRILKYPLFWNIRTLILTSQLNSYQIHFKGRCIIIRLDSTISKLLAVKHGMLPDVPEAHARVRGFLEYPCAINWGRTCQDAVGSANMQGGTLLKH